MASTLKPLGRRRHPASAKRVLVFFSVGLVLGAAIGYVFMGTTHAIIESRGAAHYGQEGDKTAAAGDVAVEAGTKSAAGGAPPKDSIHTLCTGNGSPYQNYQLRIAYATYKLIQSMPGGEHHVAFTRILHRTQPDALMDEIETFRADPLQPKCDNWCDYPVSDRGNAVRQFFDAAEKDSSMIKGEWIYMIESDYVFMKPLPLPDAASQAEYKAWGYPFDYIHPASHPNAMSKLYSGNAGDIPGTGPAPMLMRATDWKKVTPDWEKFTAVIEASEDIKRELGWVREMYAFSAALANNNMKTELKPSGQTVFIAQLPIDKNLANAHAFHYTQCTIYKTLDDKDVWAYDKRFHTSLEESLNVPAIEPPPAFQEGKWKFIEGQPVRENVHKAIEQMIGQMNKGIATLKPIAAAR